MTFEFICKYCGEKSVWDNPTYPDSFFCKWCYRHQEKDEVNKAESNLTLTYYDTDSGRRFRSR